MTIYNPARQSRAGSGTYLGIYASGYVSLFLGALLAEEMGAVPTSIDAVLFVVPALLFAGAGLVAAADNGREFFAAGRNVSALVSGLSMALVTVGGVGVVCITGALFKTGVDALALPVGWVSGLVIAGVMLFPFLRKCGAFSIPSFLGLRLDSRGVRMLSALLLAVPTALLLAAELSVAGMLGAWMTGLPAAFMMVVAAILATASVARGGMRSLTRATLAEAIATLLALTVPATIASLLVFNLPVPQLMHGDLLQAFSRLEAGQAFVPLQPGAFDFRMPTAALEPFTGPYLQSFGHIGRLALPFVIMTIATGVAGLPSLLNRAGTTTTVYETRKSVGWGVLIVAFMMLTLASIAAFLRGYVDEQLVNHAADALPPWFLWLRQMGLADVTLSRGPIGLGAIFFKRDVAFLALPLATGMPRVLAALAAAGALAATLAAAAAQIAALAGMISEDLMHGGRREAPEEGVRLWSGRIVTGAAGGIGLVLAWMVSDPLQVALAALALSSATGFPVLVLSILWRKVSRLGAVVGMLAGFGITALFAFGALTGVTTMSPLLAAAIGGPINMAVIALLSQASPLVSRRALEVVRDLRLPGGEAIYDREMRLLRRKRATAGL